MAEERDVDASARTQFYTQSFTIFTSLQSIAASQQQEEHAGDGKAWAEAGPSTQTLQYYHRIAGLYCDSIQSYIQSLGMRRDSETEYIAHVQSLHTIFYLAQVLYLPEDGRGIGVIGEELLHWLNAHDIAPTTEQGQQIAQASPSYDHPEFWDYLLRCVLRGFFSTAATVLQSYRAPGVPDSLKKVASETAQILQSLPRSTGYATEQAFLAAHRHWHTSVRVFLSGLQREMDGVQKGFEDLKQADAEEKRLELEAQFRCLLELLCGVQDRILEFAENWIEAVCVWGTLVQPALKRDTLPDVVQTITDQLPPDGTLTSDMILISLMQGDVTKCIKQSRSFDEWLAAHLGDLCNKAMLLDDVETENGTPLMDDILITWAGALLEEERLWRMALSYLAVVPTLSARTKMREILFGVPLENIQDADEQLNRVEEVLGACIDYGMDDEVRIVCQRLAKTLADQSKYGLAIAYSARARDTRQVRSIADQMLHDYVEQGPASFIKSVDTIPRTLLNIAESTATDAGLTANNSELTTPFATVPSIFSTTTFAPLMFHVKYKEFLEAFENKSTWADAAQTLMSLLTSDVTPESFLSVLLVDALPLIEGMHKTYTDHELYFSVADTHELLRVVEKVNSIAEPREPDDNYDYGVYWLEQLLQHRSKDKKLSAATLRQMAQERMQLVRLALAQYLSRILINGGQTE
ncbi:hypothetical protein MYAM1_000855 [Malassezia yamatoensis]|uniref:Nuclear pore complex protein Nup85 n=1 Tax=Malassezia yamatoensis TaxID=253288 RepID=A0AAJ5YQE7_9BASI|nr:hypothetical protein MYAM1_000855 [Malassezia yamatoensis]